MAKPPCVLFLLDWKPASWSTREEFFRQLSDELVRRGLAVLLTVSEDPAQEVRRRFEEAGARVLACSYHARPLRYWAHIRRAARAFDVRIAHVRFFDYFSLVLWMCRLSGIRNVVFTEANSGEWRSGGIKAALVRLRTALLCRPLVRVIAISDFIRRRLAAVGIPPGRIALVYNGADLAAFHAVPAERDAVREQMGASERTAVLIFAAAMLAWKRPGVALETCAELARRGVDFQLWMAGDGPLRKPLEVRARALGLESRVRWLGHQAELRRWLAGADIFLHTAVGEAFGNVLIEAMASGLPVAATRSGAVPELVVDGESGMLVPESPVEVQALAGAIQSLALDPQRRRACSEAALRRAADFSIDACVRRTLEVYRPLLEAG